MVDNITLLGCIYGFLYAGGGFTSKATALREVRFCRGSSLQ